MPIRVLLPDDLYTDREFLFGGFVPDQIHPSEMEPSHRSAGTKFLAFSPRLVGCIYDADHLHGFIVISEVRARHSVPVSSATACPYSSTRECPYSI